MIPSLFDPSVNTNFNIQKHDRVLFKKSPPQSLGLDQVRAQIIQANLNSKTSEIYILRENPSVSLVSNLEIFAAALKMTYAKKEAWKAVAYTLGTIALTLLIGASVYGIYYLLAESYNSIGHFFKITTSINGVPIHAQYRAWTAGDFASDCFQLIPGILILALSLCVVVFESIKQNPIYLNYQAIKTNLTKHAVKKLEKVAFHTGKLETLNLQNQCNENKEFEDPITLEPISENKLNTPQTLVIANCAYPLNIGLMTILKRIITLKDNNVNSVTPLGTIPHPLENRFLNQQEEQKFLKDMSALFCLADPQTLKSCWNVVSDDELNQAANVVGEDIYGQDNWRKNLIQNQNQKRVYLKQQLTPYLRILKFLALLPKDTQNHFKELLRLNLEYLEDKADNTSNS